MSEVIQSQFRGLRATGLNEKEPPDSAQFAYNVDFFHQNLEPRPGREPWATGFWGGGLRGDRYKRHVEMIPANVMGTVHFGAAIVWKYHPDCEVLPQNGAWFFIAAYDRTTTTQHLRVGLFQEAAGGPLRWYVDYYDAAGAMRYAGSGVNGNWIFNTGQEGDVYRIYAWLLRDTPGAGSCTVYLRVYRYRAGAYATLLSTSHVFAAPNANPAAWGANTRIQLGAIGCHDPTNDYQFYQYPFGGTLSDFLFWTDDTAGMNAIDVDTTWRWNVLRETDYTTAPFWHVPLFPITGWTVEQTGSDTPTTQWINPLPVLVGTTGGTERMEFAPGCVGHVDLPQDFQAQDHLFAVGVRYRTPVGFATPPGPANAILSILAAGEGWVLTLEKTSGGVNRVYLYDNAGASIFAAGAADGATGQAVVELDRLQTTTAGDVWSDVGGWANSGGFVTITWDPELELWFGGYPIAGGLGGGGLNTNNTYTILELVVAAIVRTASGTVWNEILGAAPETLLVAQWRPEAASEVIRWGPDREAIEGIWTGGNVRSPFTVIRDAVGREIRMTCRHNEAAGLQAPIPGLEPLHPPRIWGAVGFEDANGEFRIAVQTDAGVEFVDPDDPTNPQPIDESTALMAYVDHTPVVSESFRERAWFFGSSATRPKCDAKTSSRIGIERPYIQFLDADLEDDTGDLEEDKDYEIRVSLRNSGTGQESNLSNPWRFSTAASGTPLCTALLSIDIAFREGDDFDEVGVWRKHDTDGEFHLELWVRRPYGRGFATTGWLSFANFTAVGLPDIRIPLRMKQATLLLQRIPSADNWPAPAALIGAFHANRLYLIPQETPDRVVWSKEHLVESFPATHYARIGERASDPPRAMVSTPAGLLVLTRRETWLIPRGQEDDPTPDVLSSEAGCLSPASVAQYGSMYLWLSHRGVEGYDGQGVKLLSQPIRDRFRDLSYAEMATAKAGVWPRREQYWLLTSDMNLYILNLQTGQWQEGYMAAKWLGALARDHDEREELLSGNYGKLYIQTPNRREDGVGWGASVVPEPDYVNNWLTNAAGEIIAIDTSSTIAGIDLPAEAFLAFDTELNTNPRIVPITIDHVDGAWIWLAEPVDPLGETDGYIYWWVPVLYQSHRILAEGPMFRKRLKSIRTHWDPDADATTITSPRIQFLIDNQLVGAVQTIARNQELYSEISTHHFCRNWAVRIVMRGESWPSFNFFEWLYELARKT